MRWRTYFRIRIFEFRLTGWSKCTQRVAISFSLIELISNKKCQNSYIFRIFFIFDWIGIGNVPVSVTIWFITSIFISIFTLFASFSGNFDIFRYFLCNVLNACDYPLRWVISLWGLKMVRAGAFQPWNSREPIMTSPRNAVRP